MTDQPTFPQVPEVGYLSDHFESERVNEEQQFYGAYRHTPNGHMMPAVESEGSWLNSRHNPANGGKVPT